MLQAQRRDDEREKIRSSEEKALQRVQERQRQHRISAAPSSDTLARSDIEATAASVNLGKAFEPPSFGGGGDGQHPMVTASAAQASGVGGGGFCKGVKLP